MTAGTGTGQAAARQPGAGQPAGAGQPGAGQPGARNPWRAAFFGVALAAIIVGVAWALLGSRFLVVRTVQVHGSTALVSRQEVLAAAAIPAGLPMIRVNAAAVAGRVERITQVASARVSRDWPGTVVITVRQRRPVFAVQGATGYQLVDPSGVAVRSASHPPHGMPVLAQWAPTGDIAPLRGDAAVRAAATVLHELPARIARQVATVKAPDAAEVSVQLRNGDTIVWGGTGGAAQKARELAILMRTHARFYDISSPATAVTGG